MPETAASPREKFEAIRRRFGEKIEARVDEVETASVDLTEARSPAVVVEILDGLINLVHRLAGSGGSFGFPAVSEVASSFETFLRAIGARNDVLSGDECEQVLASIAALRAAAGEAPDTEDPFSLSMGATTGTGTEPSATNRLVMLGEDDEASRELIVQLEHFGFDVRVGGDAAELRAAVAEAPPSALILDVAHAHMRSAGIEVLADLRRNSFQPPAIVVSSEDALVPRIEAVRAGADAYFDKPVDAARLVEALNRLTGSEAVEPYRVLIVDDDRPLAEFYAALLERAGLDTRIVTDPMAVMAPLNEFRPDLILMDINMPGCTGIELAGVIRQRDSFAQMPIVFLTVETGFDRRIMALRTGGDDFLTKPVRPELLISSVFPRAQRSRLLGSMISQDSMTGLANHSKSKEYLEIEYERAERQGKPLAFAMIDIDKFKHVNDTYGHWTGDTVIKSLAKVLRQRLRNTDIVGRYGGEEFVAILPHTDGPAALAILDEIRDRFSRIRHTSGDAGFFVTFSCGVATCPPIGDSTRLTTAADEALYEAKRSGRNRVVPANPE